MPRGTLSRDNSKQTLSRGSSQQTLSRDNSGVALLARATSTGTARVATTTSKTGSHAGSAISLPALGEPEEDKAQLNGQQNVLTALVQKQLSGNLLAVPGATGGELVAAATTASGGACN